MREWVAAFERDPPLHHSFPIKLPNGSVLHKVVGICSACGKPVDPDHVHGRVIASMANVTTVDAHAYCIPCQQITNLHFRLRPVRSHYEIEWCGTDGIWRRRDGRPPTRFVRLCQLVLRLFASVHDASD